MVVTFLLYVVFRRVNKLLSAVAATVSLFGIAIRFVQQPPINPLVFFGFYCLIVGYLIFRSTFVPHIVGALMMFAGAGWLTFLSPRLAQSLSPYNFTPGMLGEAALTVWLLTSRTRLS